MSLAGANSSSRKRERQQFDDENDESNGKRKQIKWDPELVEKLLELRNQGSTTAQAAAAIGCTTAAVSRSWLKHHIKQYGPWDNKVQRKFDWNLDKLSRLLQLQQQGCTKSEAALELECTIAAIQGAWTKHFFNEHGPWGGGKGRGKKDGWTRESLNRLLELREEGKTLEEASEILMVSKNTVVNAWQRYFSSTHGTWGNVDRSTYMNWTEEQADELLRMRGRGLTTAQVGLEMGCSEKAVQGAWLRIFSNDYGVW